MNWKHLWLVSMMLIVSVTTTSNLMAEEYAFLVGVQDYNVTQLTKLNYARNDIVEFRNALLKSGYKSENIVLMHDDYPSLPNATRYAPHAKSIRKELELLLRGLEADDSIIVAFAGHGVQFKGEDVSYFCPLDVDLKDKERKSLISLPEIYVALKQTQARKRLLLVDACRNDPVSAIARSSGKVDVESISRPQTTPPPEGVVALFSCAPGQQAYEWPEFQHGVFFYQVLKAWNNESRTLTLNQLITDAKSRTKSFARTNIQALQTPRQMGFYEGEWILRTPTSLVGGQAGEVRSFADLGVDFCWCPPGSFTYPDANFDNNYDSGRTVTHSKGYWISSKPISVKTFMQIWPTTSPKKTFSITNSTYKFGPNDQRIELPEGEEVNIPVTASLSILPRPAGRSDVVALQLKIKTARNYGLNQDDIEHFFDSVAISGLHPLGKLKFEGNTNERVDSLSNGDSIWTMEYQIVDKTYALGGTPDLVGLCTHDICWPIFDSLPFVQGDPTKFDGNLPKGARAEFLAAELNYKDWNKFALLLQAKLRNQGRISENDHVRLVTEAEWYFAAHAGPRNASVKTVPYDDSRYGLMVDGYKNRWNIELFDLDEHCLDFYDDAPQVGIDPVRGAASENDYVRRRSSNLNSRETTYDDHSLPARLVITTLEREE